MVGVAAGGPCGLPGYPFQGKPPLAKKKVSSCENRNEKMNCTSEEILLFHRPTMKLVRPRRKAPATWSPARPHGGLARMGDVTTPLPFVGLAPCRILDTRGNGAPIQGGIFTGGSDVRNYVIPPICGRSLSLN